MGYIKMSSFRTIQQISDKDFIIGLSNGQNIKFTVKQIKDFLGVISSSGYDPTIVEPGGVLPESEPGVPKFMFLQTGTYTDPAGGTITVTSPMAIVNTDGNSYNKVFELNLTGYATVGDLQQLDDKFSIILEAFNISENLINNADMLPGAYRLSDGTISTSVNFIRTPPIPLKQGETKLNFSGGGGLSGAQARFAFQGDDGTPISQTVDDSADIPTGARFVGLTVAGGTDIGNDPTNSPYKDTIMLNYGEAPLPYEPYGAKLKAEKVDGIPPDTAVVLGNLTTSIFNIDEEVSKNTDTIASLLTGMNTEYKFPINAVYNLNQNMVLSQTGDYLEFEGRIETLTGNNVLRMFGTPPTNVNAFGFYTNVIRLRGSVSNEAWTEFTGLPSFGDYHKYRLQVNGSNWELYLDGNLHQTKPKLSDLIIGNIGNAYTPTLPFWLQGNVKIKSGTNELTISDLSSGVNVETTTSIKPDYSDIYVTFNPTGYQGRELFQVFVKMEKSDNYIGIRIYHYQNPATRYDYFRINTADEYSFNGETMSPVLTGALTNGESEFTTQLVGKSSHTGGAHGYEEIDLDGFKFIMDGSEINLSTGFTLKPCKSARVEATSRIINSPNEDGSPFDPIDLFLHKKTTYFKHMGSTYVVKNSIEPIPAAGVPTRYMYTGIACIGYNYASFVSDDRGNVAIMDDITGQRLEGTGINTLTFHNPETGRKVKVKSFSLSPTDLTEFYRMWNQNRPTTSDCKYYRINFNGQTFLLMPGDIWEAICFVTFY